MTALIGAGVLIVVVVALVLVFGIARPPELATLADDPAPAPTAAVAWTAFDRDGSCLYVAEPDGTTESLRCDLEGGDIWGWDDDGIALLTYGLTEDLQRIDPQTGETLERERLDGIDPSRPPLTARVAGRNQDGTLTVIRHDSEDVVWEVDAPEGYTINDGALSPDGEWVVMVDSAERVLVVPADGSAEPRIWADGANVWQAPVWEGTPMDEAD
jgi:hypothetical protein